MSRFDHETIPAILSSTLAEHADAPALLHVDEAASFVPTQAWQEVAQMVEAFAATLKGFGVAPGDRVAHVAENRWEWIVSDLALHVVRAVHVPIHVSLSAEQIAYQVQHSGARLVIASRADLVHSVLPQCEGVKIAVLYEPHADRANAIQGIRTELFSAALDREASLPCGQMIQDSAETTGPNDLATILYTSGTTGEPKGVMLSQRNLTTNAVAICRAAGSSTSDLRLCFLPLSHIYARTCDLYTWVHAGSRIAIARSRETVIDDCRRIKPTHINGVPYFYQKLKDSLQAAGKADQPGALADLLGGGIQTCFCGGAALPAPVAEFFDRQGVRLLAGYGLTESSPVIAAQRPDNRRRGTVGPPIEDVEVRIAADGEILTRGPHVMLGYWQDEAATREAIRGGWLYTGDLGAIDAERNVVIRGRKKEIIVLSTGKNVAPAMVEGLLTSSPLIEQAIVIGDDRKYIAALLVPNPDALRAEIIKRQIPVFTPQQALAHPKVHEIYNEEIARVLSPIAEYERVQRFKLLDRGFSIDKGELTAKLSLRRDIVAEHFHNEIEGLFADGVSTCT